MRNLQPKRHVIEETWEIRQGLSLAIHLSHLALERVLGAAPLWREMKITDQTEARGNKRGIQIEGEVYASSQERNHYAVVAMDLLKSPGGWLVVHVHIYLYERHLPRASIAPLESGLPAYTVLNCGKGDDLPRHRTKEIFQKQQ